MNRNIYRKRLLAPILFGTLLAGGCQMPGSETMLLPPAAEKKEAPTVAQPPATSAGTPTLTVTPDRQPISAAPQQPVVPDVNAQVAPNVTHISDTPAVPTGDLASAFPPPPPPRLPPDQLGGDVRSALPALADAARTALRDRLGADPEMTMKFNGSGSEIKALQAHMQMLEQRIEKTEGAVRESGVKVQAATEQLNQARAKLQQMQSETQNQITLQNKREIEFLKDQLKKFPGDEQQQPAGNDHK